MNNSTAVSPRTLATVERHEAPKHNGVRQKSRKEASSFKRPSRAVIGKVCSRYRKAVSALFHNSTANTPYLVSKSVGFYLRGIQDLLSEQIGHAVLLQSTTRGGPVDNSMATHIGEVVASVFDQLPELTRLLSSDVQAAFANDPAATGCEEVLLTYPCIEAITLQRLAHRFYLSRVPVIPRMMTEIAHSHTGIDIHPGATIGESFFVDHGTGVVIGETATIGDRVTLYHGVTLGASNPLLKDAQAQLLRGCENKRHPDLEDAVTVYSNATILGGETRIGHHSTIGCNVRLTHSVPPYSKVTSKDSGVSVHSAIRSGHTDPA